MQISMISCYCTVFIILLHGLATAANSCIQTSNLIGAPLDSSLNSTFMIKSGMQVIIPSYQFDCCGRVAEWRIRVPNTIERFENSITIELQVWQPNIKYPRCYRLVGNNSFTKFSSINGIITLSPPPNNKIQAQPTDILGLRIYGKPGLEVHATRDTTTPTRQAVTATTADHCSRRPRYHQYFTLAKKVPTPAISASLEPADNCNPNPNPQSPSTDSPWSNIGIIVGTSLAGTIFALLLLISVIIIALLIIIKRRVTRHFTSPSFQHVQQEQDMGSNHCEFSTSYSYVRHCHEQSITTQENQAYTKMASNQDTTYYETYY